VEVKTIPDIDVVAARLVSGDDLLVRDRKSGEKLLLLFPRSIEPGGDVPLRYEKDAAAVRGKGVPEAEDPGSAVEDDLGVGLAEEAGDLAHLSCRVMVRRPSSSEATQAAQRQRLMRRRAVRKSWQTGQRWR
jgi:hypothetical protein